MKISSVSKKVLASALSAAMVVTFAPTVALADTATAQTIAVNYSAGNGTVQTGQLLEGEILQVSKTDAGHLVITPGKTTANEGKLAGDYNFSNWFVDADNDGILDEDEIAIDGSGKFDLTAAGLDAATSITLKAAYNKPAFNFVNDYFTSGNTFKIGIDKSAAKAGHEYKLTIVNPAGATIGTKVYDGTALASSEILVFTDTPTVGELEALTNFRVSGQYTFTLTDNKVVISEVKKELVKVTAKVGDKTWTRYNDTNTNSTLPAYTDVDSAASGYVAYVDEDGYYVGAPDDLAPKDKDITVVATKTVQAAKGLAYTADLTGKPGYLTYTVDADADAKHVVSIVNPKGAEIYSAAFTGDAANNISFDPKAAGARATESEMAGTYVVNVTTTVGTGASAVTTTSKAKVTLSEVKYVAGEGAKFTADKPVTTLFTSAEGSSLYTFVDTNKPGVAAKTDFGGTVVWKLNGAAYNAKTNKGKVGETNTYEATFAATKYAAAPTWSIAKSTVGTTNYYTLTVAPAAGTTVTYKVGTSGAATYTAPVVLSDADIAAGVELVAYDLGNTAKTINLVSGKADLDAWKSITSGASSYLELNIGNDTAKWSGTAGVSAAVAAGTTALTADVDAILVDADKHNATVKAAAKDLYDAVVAESAAQIAKYENGAYVVAGENAYVMTATQVADAKKAIAAQEIPSSVTEPTVNDYVNYGLNVLKQTNTELKKAAKAPVTAADIKAADDVTAALKAATTGEAAEKALADYAALTDTQKKLVATADVVAAENVLAAAQLKAAQDKAAAASTKARVKATTYTVKKATGKKTVKLINSKSGAKTTLKQAKASKYVTVSGTTIKLKKAAKAGKTYKVKVKVITGAYTTYAVTMLVKVK